MSSVKSKLFNNGNYELYNKAVFSSLACMFDIGANRGGYTETYLDIADNVKEKIEVHCFEPVPDMFKIMSNRFESEKRGMVKLNNKALGSTSETLRDCSVFNVWTIAPRGHVHDMQHAAGYEGSSFDMEVTTLDAYCGKNISPTYIKLDVDGYELRVLQGGAEVLNRCKPPIHFELSALGEKLGDTVQDMINYTLSIGYVFFSMDGKFSANSLEAVLLDYPWTTSFDVILLHKDRVSEFL